MDIVLVHGFMDRGHKFDPLNRALTAAGHRCFAPSLTPRDARLGIVDLAGKLERYIESTLVAEQSFALVGFSMGCLISRYYLQELAGVERCRAFFAIAGPLQGSRMAHLYFGRGAADMRPGSHFLLQLQAGEHKLGNLPIHSYRTPYDLMIIPSISSHWPRAENHISSALAHPLMLRNRLVTQHILQTLADLAV
ncbi:esterase/lipase family protein [Halioxenophilus sp. WMMB6]|uniref:esterase/lipase family protein n=1 Tax=Halioxenophilus sp. WMMB6 TaxID=3073815 RepID=UPI00295E5C79|nr:alpha/beta fold hydrolase [Halioxenophilus sp. WMMB6]